MKEEEKQNSIIELKGGVAILNFELIAKRFSELRDRSGFTQGIIAEYLGVDQSYISKCEKGERQFSVDVLDKASELFGCTIEYFVNESTEFTQMPIAPQSKECYPRLFKYNICYE